VELNRKKAWVCGESEDCDKVPPISLRVAGMIEKEAALYCLGLDQRAED